MSLTSINMAANDDALIDRIIAAANKEAYANDAFGDSMFGGQVKGGGAPIRSVFAYPVAIDNEAAYESAIAAENPNPGGDPSVITDAAISTAVQVYWPWSSGEQPPA